MSDHDQPTSDHRPTGDLSPQQHTPASRPPAPIGAQPGDQIGPYKLIAVLGEGGFGVVYLAERRQPMVQRVALKILKPGMNSREVLARFEQERQALAVMDHPNVARVLDAGATPQGLPYFVMEHVQGESITAHCDREKLSIRRRLELFIPVCEAVQHAHHKGIIHRDIKPSNILVSTHEGRAVPKVIDFGVAKAVSHTLTEQTIFTEQGRLIGTPEYMSPEQAEMGATDIDTRSDVYSLGVVLYELLVGILPFDAATLRGAGYVEIQRIIREVDPPKPSARLSRLIHESEASVKHRPETLPPSAHGEASSRSIDGDRPTTRIAASRRVALDELARDLRRELDWIPLKALRKNRSERYATPMDLARDIQRYLDGDPLEAGPESAGYRLRKFVRRHKGPVLAGALVVAVLIAGMAGTLWQAAEARKQTIEARHQTQLADAAAERERERADQLKQVSDFQAGMLAQIDPTQAGWLLSRDVLAKYDAALVGMGLSEMEHAARLEQFAAQWRLVNTTDAARALIDRTILKPALEAIDQRFKDQPVVDARLRQALADLYRDLGLYDDAHPLQMNVLETRRRVLGEEHEETLQSVNTLSNLLLLQSRYAEAEAHILDSLEKTRRVLGEEHEGTLTAIANMGALLHHQGRPAEAEPHFRAALEARRRISGNEHPHTILAVNNVGFMLWFQGKYVETEPLFREALETSRRVLGEEHPQTIICINNMGSLLQTQGRFNEAEPYFRESLDKYRRVLGEEHPYTLNSINNMGGLLQAQGKLSEAEPFFRESLEKSRRVLGEEHLQTITAISSIGFLLQAQGRYDEAELYYIEALEKNRRVLGETHAQTITAVNNMGFLLQTQGRYDEAEPYVRESLDTFRRLYGDEHPHTLMAVNNMGAVLHAREQFAEAEAHYREALEKNRLVLGEDHPQTFYPLANLGRLFQEQDRFPEAETYLREAMEKRRRVLGDEHPETLVSINNFGTLLRKTGRLDEAERHHREAVNGLQRVRGEDHLETIVAINNLGAALLALDRHAEALELLAPIEPKSRTAFTDGNAPRIASVLLNLGKARATLARNTAEFTLAETNLLESHRILMESAAGADHEDAIDAARTLVDLYTRWHALTPDADHDVKAAEWREKTGAVGE